MISPMHRIGLISDTHGLLRPQALAFLRGCQRILHAGDIGDPAILAQLNDLAPTAAVRGNNDRGPWAQTVPATKLLQCGATWLYMVHDLAEIDIDPAAAGVAVVVSGHSHKPRIDQRDGVLYINPGSAGPRRFTLPIAVAEVIIDRGLITPRIVELEAG